MPQRTRSVTRKQSRPKASIDAICLDELLAAAGMSGFLGILDPPAPVPYLQRLVDEIRSVPSEREGLKFSRSFSERVEAILSRMSLQQKELSAVVEAWQRIAAAVETLNREAGNLQFDQRR